jgi:hypothetical protein
LREKYISPLPPSITCAIGGYFDSSYSFKDRGTIGGDMTSNHMNSLETLTHAWVSCSFLFLPDFGSAFYFCSNFINIPTPTRISLNSTPMNYVRERIF